MRIELKKILFLLAFICTSLSPAFSTVTSLDSIYILNESDLTQCSDHAPVFSWEIKRSLPENCLMNLTILDLDSSRIIWRMDSLPSEIRSFEFISLNTLKDGGNYRFKILIEYGDSLLIANSLSFHMNTLPSTLQFLSASGKTIRSDTLTVLHTVPADRESQRLRLQFQISINSSFTGILKQAEIYRDEIRVTEKGAESRLDISSLPDNKRYFLRVRVQDGSEWGYWSDTLSFWLNRIDEAPERFSLISPQDSSFSDWEPVLKWQRAADPDSNLGGGVADYTILISEKPDLSKPDTVGGITGNSLKLKGLKRHVRYFWTVLAEDSTGLTTVSKDTFTFITNAGNTPPELPLLISFPDSILAPSDSICLVGET